MAYTIEEEQELNELKTWWKENYKSIIVIVLLAFSGVFGWRYWQDYQTTKKQTLSAQYDELISSAENQSIYNAQLDRFVQENGETTYAVFALLDKAKLEVSQQNFVQAEETLKQAIVNTSDDILMSITAIRLATVQYQLQKFDEALASLNQVKGQSWDVSKLLLSGDIQLAKGNKEIAKDNFEQALTKATSWEKSFIQVRLNSL
ncbi:YfgM family protein [Histophilus somni]|uniref:YfgM family protein n=1 Tax=Histophilus somni TaxID=731 RepID=UPI0000397454|nr:YfgM family protein [Histophilus somni]ACA32398.1 conserved hypothetical protein [Histophilus somni 2336]QQF86497.1 YfgM family protein [Histophilus somni]QQJ89699.1 YfgM family protein [Histophilus somni]